MAGLTQEQIAAALSDNVYRWADQDQPITLANVPGASLQPIVTPAGLTLNGGFYYDDSTGFVGTVTNVNGTIYVTFRGVDIGGGTFNLPQWTTTNLPLGLGLPTGTTLTALDPTTGAFSATPPAQAVTELDDAIALTQAAIASAPPGLR